MAEPDIVAALELLVDHTPMPSDLRKRIVGHLTGEEYQPGPIVAPDPRDEEIKALKAQLAERNAEAATAPAE